MSRRSIFGSHLYSQIVAPLVVAAVVVGLVATAVAVYFLRDLTDQWVQQFAESSTVNLVNRQEEFARQMQRVTAFAAQDTALREAVASGDPEAIADAVADENAVLGFDCLMVLDPDGRTLAAEGILAAERGERPFGRLQPSVSRRVSFDSVDGSPVLMCVQPIFHGSQAYSLVSAYTLDGMYLSGLGLGSSTAYMLFTGDKQLAASTVSSEFEEAERSALLKALEDPSPELLSVLDGVDDDRAGRGTVAVDNLSFKMWALPIRLPGSPSEGVEAYAVGIVSQGVTQRAGSTTTNLIMMWSLAAIVALVGMGGWVARRVSDPLAALATGARKIADGDFSTKVRVEGTNEVAQLAESFNVMTDSLRERSDTLTKKVLELATLYEMSRALGSTLEMDELLESVLDSALRIFDLDMGYVTLRDPETGALSIRAMRSPNQIDDQEALRSSMSEWVAREGRPLIFNPESGDAKGRIDTVTGAKAALCVPLISSEGTIGSVTVGSSDPEYRFTSDDVRLLSTIANHVTIAIGNIELFSNLHEAYLATVRSLAAAVDAKDHFTRGHSDRVAMYASLIAERLGMTHDQRTALEMAAFLHDIGKIGVPEEILLKPGRLDDAEMAQMRHHPLIGANILQPVAFPWPITPIVRHHHEYYDGSGYPAGLRGEEIPILARILSIADSFEAMTADRPYRKGMACEAAIAELRRCAGTQFDPQIVEVFVEILEELEGRGESLSCPRCEEIAPDEARAVFSALVDGLLMSFRKLGGPRLASNVELELDEHFASTKMPFRIVRGRTAWVSDCPECADSEIQDMRAALKRIEVVMVRLSGSTLLEHFYADAAEGLSARMLELTGELEFYKAS